jgi:hypothetical protein
MITGIGTPSNQSNSPLAILSSSKFLVRGERDTAMPVPDADSLR